MTIEQNIESIIRPLVERLAKLEERVEHHHGGRNAALTLAEVADRLQVCERTVANLIRAGKLHRIPTGRLVRVMESEFNRFVRQ